jgi:uncharacterized protein (DUF2141 family)
MKRVAYFICLSLFSFFLWKCASLTTPTGGPKDEAPPALLNSTPAHNQKNFKGSIIELTFDETIQLFNPKDEILISPDMGKDIEFSARKDRVIIEPEGAWADSTTYSILFREGIKDLNEGNPAENLRIAFSTGPYIDSLFIAGSINEVLTEKIPENITIAIYESDTFNVFEHAPSYLTKSDKQGRFRLENLKQGVYHVYAFDDKNKNLKIESKTEKFGFLSAPIHLDESKDSLKISVFKLDSRELHLQSVRRTPKTTRLRFNKYITHYSLDSPQPLIHSFGDDQMEVSIYTPENILDSLAINIIAHDSLDQRMDTVTYLKTVDIRSIKDAFNVTYEKPSYDYIKKTLRLRSTYSLPLAAINYDSLLITIDSTTTLNFSAEEMKIDTLNKSFELVKPIHPDSLFKVKTSQLKFKMGVAALISVEGDSSKAASSTLAYTKEEDTGTLLIEVETDHTSYEIQILGGQDKVVSSVRNVKEYAFKYLAPQSYKLRVLIDTNHNAKWDTGNPILGTEPEPIFYYTNSEQKFEFPIRANWELGPFVLKF